MKFRSLLSIVLLALSVIAISINASPQTTKEALFKVNVPFDFVAGGAHLPAGRYAVYHVSTKSLILIESVTGRGAAFMLVNVTTSGAGEHPNTLVFNQYGDRYFLSQVTTENNREIHVCSKSREEQVIIAQRKASEKQAVATGY
jgi:hypothetical protein